MNKPYDQVGPAGIEATIEYYLNKEHDLSMEYLAIRAEREHWERALQRLDRDREVDKE